MGNSASSQTPQAGNAHSDSQTRRRSTIWRRSSAVRPSESLETAHDTPRPRTNRPRPASANRLSQLIQQQSAPSRESSTHDHDHSARPSLSSRLQRPSRHSVFLDASQSLFPRGRRNATTAHHQDLWPSEQRGASAARSSNTSSRQQTDIVLPNVDLPDLDLDFTQTSSTASGPATQRSPSRRSSMRIPSGIADRLGLRSQRQSAAAATSNVLSRRRRSPIQPGEDSTALLSRLLSVAAAATAATLLEGSEQSMAEARGTAGDGDDGTFDSFLQSLESGRLAAALRQGTQAQEGAAPGSGQPPLNFFRMFRFNPTATRNSRQAQQNGDNRMVPIIIVGIRAVSPNANVGGSEDTGVPPFLDALSTLPTTPFNANNLASEISDGLRGPQNGTRFSHRRRASMSGLSRFPSGYDNQRHHRSPEGTRPHSVASELASWPRPPPATPASPNLSTVNSRSNTPAPTVPTSRRSSFSGTARRESIIRTTTTTTLETTTESTPARTRPTRPRRASDAERRNSGYASRRNGFVEPDGNVPSDNTRSWIIYVLGGSYPENHPILTTPSLFTDSPTYEDMMLLSTLLGPAKPPVATENDVASAGGLYQIRVGANDKNEPVLVAFADESDERIELAPEQRCLVCLCDFEKEEEARKLTDCGHLYHRECIDEWLTKGRNSCPLCRGQGVQEKDKKPDVHPVDSARPSPVIPSEPEVSPMA
ncbi:hypothetical protein B9Z65_8489 [Elsinoe australis]|uniref:RING-type domain-containing protein n=1 Tax=Elsinoe australis TaxID=40998 RepID=A0A2P7YDX4_9PEZI|nr:hypothetical protein B9Z65_8489 [Elsinoe australis]